MCVTVWIARFGSSPAHHADVVFNFCGFHGERERVLDLIGFLGRWPQLYQRFSFSPLFFFFFTRLSSASAEGTNVLGGRVFIASFFFFSLLFFFRIFYPMILIELCSVRIESV